jgi:putative NADPH-quinone reductase
MRKRIAIIQGHPDPGGGHFCHVLAAAYGDGARQGGHRTMTVNVATLDFPVLRSKADWDSAPLPAGLADARDAMHQADHLALLFPLWLGGMPALLKAFLEQVLRPDFSTSPMAAPGGAQRPLAGKSARIVVTMGMPALVYRWYFCAHGVKSLERGILGFCGVAPIRRTLIGSVETAKADVLGRRLEQLRELGRRAR